MIKISTNFDSRKFARDLEKGVRASAEKQIRSKLRRLTAKGLRVSFRGSKPSNLDVRLDGPADLIAEAKQLLR